MRRLHRQAVSIPEKNPYWESIMAAYGQILEEARCR